MLFLLHVRLLCTTKRCLALRLYFVAEMPICFFRRCVVLLWLRAKVKYPVRYLGLAPQEVFPASRALFCHLSLTGLDCFIYPSYHSI